MAQDQRTKGKPLDPTNNAQDMMGDTSGLSGITTTQQQRANKDQDDEDALMDALSAAKTQSAQEEGRDDERTAATTANDNTNTPVSATSDQQLDRTPPSIAGEQSISGDMPDPESDDNTLEAAQDVGEALDADEEHPKPVDIASDIDKAEEYHRTH